MFGTNQVVGRTFFKDYKSDELAVNVAFATLQGEGPMSGRRCVFLRLSKCLLSCYFCDTSFEEINVFQFEDLRDYLKKKATDWMDEHNVEYAKESPLSGWGLVVTGGEPMLQENLWEFIHRQENEYHYSDAFDWFQIETTGTQPWKEHYSENMIVVVSPKCVENNGIPYRHMKPHKSIFERANCFKFVITANDISPYSGIPDWAMDWKHSTTPSKPIYLSPMNVYLREPQASLIAAKTNTTLTIEQREVLEKISFWEEGLLDMEANRKNHEYTAFLCMKYDCILSLQTHLLASLP